MSDLVGWNFKKSQLFQLHSNMVQILLRWTIWAIFTPLIACVLPVAPDFQDPLKAPNYYPYFQDTAPFQQRTFSPAGQPVRVTVSVGDQNLGDTLYVRWVSDYPIYVQNSTKVLRDSIDGRGMPYPPASTAETEIRPPFDYDVDCLNFAPGEQQHRVVIIVSDRPFLMPTTFSGDLRYNLVGTRPDGFPITYPIMTGWNVVCPP